MLTNKNSSISKTGVSLFVINTLGAISLYIILHESGHLITALLFDANISSYTLYLWDPHVSFYKIDMSPLEIGIVATSGALFPYFIALISLFTVRRNIYLSYYSNILYIICTFSLLSYIFPMNNGDTNNLLTTGVSFAIVSMIASILMIVSIFIFIKLGKINSYLKSVNLILNTSNKDNSGKHLTKKYLPSLIFIFSLFINYNNISVDVKGYDQLNYKKLNGDYVNYNLGDVSFNEEDTILIKLRFVKAKELILKLVNKANKRESMLINATGFSADPEKNIYLSKRNGLHTIVISAKDIQSDIYTYKKATP
ncbi:MAG: hypothetical protein ACEPOV_07360 [Hyphomicrobiales bacterium]